MKRASGALSSVAGAATSVATAAGSAAASSVVAASSAAARHAGGSSESEDSSVVPGVVRAKELSGSGLAAASSAAGMATSVASDAAQRAGTVAKAAAADSRQRAGEMIRQLKLAIEVWAKQKAQRQIERVIDRIPRVAKRTLEDEQMPRFVSRGKDRLVDSVWPDIRTEILWEAAVLMDRAPQQPVDLNRGVDCFRAFFRYHLQPYDKSFWGKLRDPWFVLCNIISLIPLYGIYPAWFTFVFIIIDKRDEFQLIQFILSFKGTAFMSQGLFRAVIGFVYFIGCVTAPANASEHECESRGPGTMGNIWPMSVGLAVQVLLVWVAFLLLRCSKEKGRTAIKGSIQVREEGHATVKGGYIIYFLWYDLLAFIICCGIVALAVSTRPDDFALDDWPVQHVVFAAQSLYGLLSMPFFLFTLPLLQRMLTHAMPTAYDERGVCRKPISPPTAAKPAQQEELVTEADVNDLYGKLKAIIPMPV